MSTKDLIITQRQKVRESFGKSEKDVLKDIEIMREWIKTQPHLPEIASDSMIEFFLVVNKFSIERAKQKLDMYYTIRRLIPDFYENKHPKLPQMQEASKMSFSCVLPKLTKELYRVSVMKITGDPDIFDFCNLMSYHLNILEIRIQEDVALGDVYIIDHENLKMGHVVKMTPSLIKKIATVFEKVFSNRMKGLHIINYPPFIDILVNIAKTLLKPKLIKRMHLHPKVEDLYQHISKDVLPSDYGGEEKSLEELHELWNLKVGEYSDRFDKLAKMKVNEDLRPEPLKNDDILGFHGNFKQLDVD